MTKHGLLRYLFEDDIYPTINNKVTGKLKKLTDIKKWNDIAFANHYSIWEVGWYSIKTGKWTKEDFEINE